MAQPTFAPASPGDALNAAAWNALFNDIVTQSGNIQAANIRDEGLDRRSLGIGSVNSLHIETSIGTHTAVSYGDAGATVNMSAWVVVGHSGTNLRIDNGGAGWDFDADKQIAIIRCSWEVRRAFNDNVVQFQLWQSTTAGGVVAMTYTERRLEFDRGTTQSTTHACPMGTVASLHADGHYDWIELRVVIVSGAHAVDAERLWLSEGNISLQIWDR